MSHTILLVQSNARPQSRTYVDYESVEECLESVCKMFEDHLKQINPHSQSITYDIINLFDFVDQLTDLCCLVYEKSLISYVPQNKEWIKKNIYKLLLKKAVEQ